MAITLDEIGIEDVSNFFPSGLGIRVGVLRLDKVDEVISGNKYFKLKHNLKAATDSAFDQVITFGGAYSNHLIATAAAAQNAGLKSVGIVRGLHAKEAFTSTLIACKTYGMQLHFVSRDEYKRKADPEYLDELFKLFGSSFIIPEGGDNDLGRYGTEEIGSFIDDSWTHVCLPIGTGTTFVGIRNALPVSKAMVGFTAMKGGQYLEKEIKIHLTSGQNHNWQLEERFHFGGFAKTTNELIDFMKRFYQSTRIPLDIVYTGKMMFGIDALVKAQNFPNGAHILAVHTDGLQGNPDGLFQE